MELDGTLKGQNTSRWGLHARGLGVTDPDVCEAAAAHIQLHDGLFGRHLQQCGSARSTLLQRCCWKQAARIGAWTLKPALTDWLRVPCTGVPVGDAGRQQVRDQGDPDAGQHAPKRGGHAHHRHTSRATG